MLTEPRGPSREGEESREKNHAGDLTALASKSAGHGGLTVHTSPLTRIEAPEVFLLEIAVMPHGPRANLENPPGAKSEDSAGQPNEMGVSSMRPPSIAFIRFFAHGRWTMFDSIDDQSSKGSSSKEKMMVWLGVAVVSILLFGGLYLSVRPA